MKLNISLFAMTLVLPGAGCSSSEPQSSAVALARSSVPPAPLSPLPLPGPVPCGPITAEGCCDSETLWYCNKGTLVTLDCAAAPKCGWVPVFNLYDCGTKGGADPTTVHPKSCGALVGDAGLPSLDVGAPDVGPTDASAIDLPTTDMPPPADSGPGCGNVTPQGCCDGQTLWYCDKGAVQTINCSGNLSCGWHSSGVYDCGTAGLSDPAGKHPKPCAPGKDSGIPTSDTGTPDAAPSGCGGVTAWGCCAGTTLWFCSGGSFLVAESCVSTPQCGWSNLYKQYNCNTPGGHDPGGSYPMICPGMDGGAPDAGLPDLTSPAEQGPLDLAVPDVGATDQPRPDAATADAPRADLGGDQAVDPGEDGCSCRLEAAPGSGAARAAPAALVCLLWLAFRRRSRR